MSATSDGNGEDDIPTLSFLDSHVRKNSKTDILRCKSTTGLHQKSTQIIGEEIDYLQGPSDSLNVRRREQQPGIEPTETQIPTVEGRLVAPRLQAHHIENQVELKSTEAQIHTSEVTRMVATNQQTTLQAQLGSLSLATHPIQRCPEDILRSIFQQVTEMTGTSIIIQSVRLSSVCKRWRNITLDSPSLWGSLNLDLNFPHDSQAYLRDTILPRIKHAPATLMVAPINRKTAPSLKICGLDKIPNIRYLRLGLSSSNDVAILTGADFQPPTGVVHTLSITSSQSSPSVIGRRSPPPVDILDVLSRLSSVEDLKIRRIYNTAFRGVCILRSIRKIVLFNVDQLKILDLLRNFPKLEHLELARNSLRMSGNPPVLLVPSVRYLSISATTGEDWMAHISFTNLHTLVYKNIYSDAVIAFISVHPSIIRLNYSSATGIRSSLATAAPQLLELIVSPAAASMICGSIGTGVEPPFPRLKSVTIIPNHGPQMTLHEFDRLVCSRCLPMKHPKSSAGQTSHVLIHFAISRMFSTVEWHESEFYKSSTRTAHPREKLVECLSWPGWA